VPVDQQDFSVETAEATLEGLSTIRPAKPTAQDDNATPSKYVG
jgi:hypothetical protein